MAEHVSIFILVVALTLAFAVVYFMPTIIAVQRGHKNALAIGVLNLLLGGTGLGWVVALVWSLTNP
jgi:hypothetical protein